MARKRKSQALTDAKKYYKLLLYEASGGNLGTEPEIKSKKETLTFVEKNRLLAEIVKIAGIEQKDGENEEIPSGMDIIRRNLEHDDREARGRGNTWGTAESGANESDTDSADDSSEQGS